MKKPPAVFCILVFCCHFFSYAQDLKPVATGWIDSNAETIKHINKKHSRSCENSTTSLPTAGASHEKYFEWIIEIARGATMMTRTMVGSIQVDADMHEALPNRVLSEVIVKNLELVGPPKFNQEERKFAAKMQEPLGRKFEKALSEDVESLPAQRFQGLASTDVGDISWFVPVGQLTATTHSFGSPGHSWQVVACTGMSIGQKGMIVAGKALAYTAIDLLLSQEFVQKAKEDFRKVRDPLNYITLIPEGQNAPKTIR
ncbi:MAG: hypothetical protein HYY49_08170 [Ignavibacteriales bacterium]|nr:hypothetical protein [Ignavibacteriales bacterium]